MLIKDLSDTMHKKSKEIISIYEDRDESFKTENAIYSGHVTAQSGEDKPANLMDNFYAKLEEIDVSGLLLCDFVP